MKDYGDIFSVRTPTEQKRKLMVMAEATRRSMSGFFLWIVDQEWERFKLTPEGQRALAEYRERANEAQN